PFSVASPSRFNYCPRTCAHPDDNSTQVIRDTHKYTTNTRDHDNSSNISLNITTTMPTLTSFALSSLVLSASARQSAELSSAIRTTIRATVNRESVMSAISEITSPSPLASLSASAQRSLTSITVVPSAPSGSTNPYGVQSPYPGFLILGIPGEGPVSVRTQSTPSVPAVQGERRTMAITGSAPHGYYGPEDVVARSLVHDDAPDSGKPSRNVAEEGPVDIASGEENATHDDEIGGNFDENTENQTHDPKSWRATLGSLVSETMDPVRAHPSLFALAVIALFAVLCL
ncbi:hypothetical protein BJ170DRAFT_711198, partial [Xylariales sp. AK1849]